jgi:hyperpolarization activated cyclic nucleotide-gated potassium channel 1
MEMIIASGWMIVGGGFYSYTVGSLSSILSNLDTQNSLIDQKTAAARELARETGLSKQVLRSIVDAVQYRVQRSCLVWSDRHALFSGLPKELRFEVASSMYGGALKDSCLLRNQQKAFITFAVPLFTPMHVTEQTLLYHQGEYADEMYFVTAGWGELLLMPQQVTFRTYLKGSYFGEVEVLFSLPRLHSCLCSTRSQLFVLTKMDFLRLLEEFPAEKKQLLRVASERRRREQQSADELSQLLTYRQLHGSLSALAGKPQLQPTQPLPSSSEAQLAALKVHSAELRPLAQALSSEVDAVRRLLRLP